MRRIVSALALAAVCAVAAACGTAAGSADAGLVVAVVTPSTGALSVFAAPTLDAARLGVDEVNRQGGVNGKKVRLVLKSYDGTAAGGLNAAREVAQLDHATVLTGFFTSDLATALQPQLAGLHLLMIDANDVATSLTASTCTQNYFRVTASADQQISAIAAYLSRGSVTSWSFMGADYSFGHDAAAGFRAKARKLGYRVSTPLFAPLGTQDFGSYVTTLQGRGTQGLFIADNGSDGINLIKEAAQFGLLAKLRETISFSTITGSTLPAMGNAAIGVKTALPYDTSVDTGPETKAFAAAYQARFHDAPTNESASTYASIGLTVQAARAAHSTTATAIGHALSGLTTRTVFGSVTMRAQDHQLVRPVSIATVVKGPTGKPAFKVISTEPGPVITAKVSCTV